ncbi:hypothetical protein PUNSTDRAFT_67477 [Punctularia strigosozonata HHB-11173 SS5]|uniref:uncharacterized protein n=1 Tax=Punctularia strigosozonata (strain HHB-11173) TaxID=741275 RepID=UPI00044177AD|nr:uncharacterized protein PUNSTDRAFT_67477 [Punctularia strigosozonata HHB-11173 SS5]EIN09184.1 hypothetical protein PUNSTDRAFT_67477 [Punctularia strigosozonata HHB-11173 SS5]
MTDARAVRYRARGSGTSSSRPIRRTARTGSGRGTAGARRRRSGRRKVRGLASTFYLFIHSFFFYIYNSGRTSPAYARFLVVPLDPGTPPAAFESWTPVPLRPWFWITFACVMVGVAIGLEVALSISKKRNGEPASPPTLPPVFVAGLFVALWTWTDVEVKKLQVRLSVLAPLSPYADASGSHTWTWCGASPSRSTRSCWTIRGSMFLSAAGYASAAALYDLEPPPFITKDGYTVAPFELPTDIASNGTARVNATAVQSDPGCQFAQVSMVQFNDSDGVLFWNNSASFNGCTFSWNVSRLADHLFGTDLVQDCQQDTPSQFQPLVFWFFTYLPKPAASISFCTPSIHLRSVLVDVSIADGNVTALRDVGPLAGNFSSLAANVSSLAGAYNGISFPFVNDTTDPFVLERGNATRFVLPAAIFQAAQTSPQGLTATFSTDGFLGLSTSVYRTFLALVAKSVYFLSAQEPIYMEVLTIKKRLFLSDVAVHLLAAALFILAIFSTSLQFLHRGEREELRLAHKPGTIASAMSIGGRSTVGELLDGRQREEDIVQALRDKRFRIDPRTMKIVMQGEEGYESASTPRKSVFESLSVPAGKISNRFSKRFSTSKTTPLPPSTP